MIGEMGRLWGVCEYLLRFFISLTLACAVAAAAAADYVSNHGDTNFLTRERYRGYYTVARTYEVYLRVENIFILVLNFRNM